MLLSKISLFFPSLVYFCIPTFVVLIAVYGDGHVIVYGGIVYVLATQWKLATTTAAFNITTTDITTTVTTSTTTTTNAAATLIIAITLLITNNKRRNTT